MKTKLIEEKVPVNGERQKHFYSLGEQWAIFLTTVFSPIVLILLLGVLALAYSSVMIAPFSGPPLSTTNTSSGVLTAFLTALISVFSGLLGALVWQRWSELTEKGVLVTRGKSAIRGLKLILLNVTALEERTKTHIARLDQKASNHELVRNNLEEVIEKCNSLQEEVINSIEEWVDIIPEADLKTQIGLISKLKGDTQILEADISNLHQQLTNTQEKDAEERRRLEESVQEKEKELSQVKQTLRVTEARLNSSVLSGISNVVGSTGLGTTVPNVIRIVSSPTARICSSCPKLFSPPFEGNTCPSCGGEFS